MPAAGWGHGVARAARAIALGGALSSCAELPAVPVDQCGNAVVEPAAGEDCDTFAPKGSRCIAPGEPNQCRLQCEVAGSGGPACPEGMACGVDGLCRTATRDYAEMGPPIAAVARELLTGDVDGDGRVDVLTVRGDGVRVHYFDGDAVPDGTLELPGTPAFDASAVVCDLTADHRSDVLLPLQLGVSVMIGTEERTIEPTAHPGITVDPSVSNIALAAGKFLPEVPSEDLLILGTIGAGSALVFLPTTGQIDLLALVALDASALAGPMSVERFDERPASECDQAVVSYRDEGAVLVYMLCERDAAGEVILSHSGAFTSIDLGGATVEREAAVLDANADGYLDLVVAVRRGDAHEVSVAYGLGDGTFHGSPPGASPPGAAATASTYGVTEGGTPLSVADLDGDGVLDYVTDREIRVSRGLGFGAVPAGINPREPWSEAEIVDMTADGVADVVATSGTDRIVFYEGDGTGRFTSVDIGVRSGARRLTVGDFDGDRVSDVAFVTDALRAQPGDSVTVLFGRPWQAPAVPLEVGTVDPTVQLLTTYSARNGVVDGAAELVTASRSPGGGFTFSAFEGSGDRVLRAPYSMTESRFNEIRITNIQGYFPTRLATGDFDADGHEDLVAIAHTNTSPPEQRLWLTPSAGEARLLAEGSVKSDLLADDFAWDRSIVAAVDLDADGIGEFVAFGASSADPAEGLSVVARVVRDADGLAAWTVSAANRTPLTFDRSENQAEPSGFTRGAAARVRDIDANGLLDIAVLGHGAGGLGAVLVFLGDGSGELAEPLEVTPDPEESVAAFALLQADADPVLELALAIDGQIRLADYDVAGRTFTVTAAPIASVLPARLLAAGDIDGDGIDDLVASDGEIFSLLRGAPRIR